MKVVFEGEAIKADLQDFDFIEIKRNTQHYLLRTPYFLVPPPLAADKADFRTAQNTTGYILVNYYKQTPCASTGILEYDEFAGFTASEAKCVRSVVFKVVAPVVHQEFYRDSVKYLALSVKVPGPYEVSVECGTLVKDGVFYKVFGTGRYVLKTDSLLYKF